MSLYVQWRLSFLNPASGIHGVLRYTLKTNSDWWRGESSGSFCESVLQSSITPPSMMKTVIGHLQHQKVLEVLCVPAKGRINEV